MRKLLLALLTAAVLAAASFALAGCTFTPVVLGTLTNECGAGVDFTSATFKVKFYSYITDLTPAAEYPGSWVGSGNTSDYSVTLTGLDPGSYYIEVQMDGSGAPYIYYNGRYGGGLGIPVDITNGMDDCDITIYLND